MGLTGRIFDTKDLAKGHLLQWETHLGLTRKLVEGGFGILGRCGQPDREFINVLLSR